MSRGFSFKYIHSCIWKHVRKRFYSRCTGAQFLYRSTCHIEVYSSSHPFFPPCNSRIFVSHACVTLLLLLLLRICLCGKHFCMVPEQSRSLPSTSSAARLSQLKLLVVSQLLTAWSSRMFSHMSAPNAIWTSLCPRPWLQILYRTWRQRCSDELMLNVLRCHETY